MTDSPADDNRPEPPLAGSEAETLLGFLDHQRATLLWKLAGTSDEAVQRRLADHPSTMTLAGVVNHLAWVEDYWFTEVASGAPTPERWADIDWEADPDGEWNAAAGQDLVGLRTVWQESVARSRAVVTALFAEHDDALATTHPAWGGRAEVSLRWILTHMIEEYARHNGHADLLREAIDGQTGE